MSLFDSVFYKKSTFTPKDAYFIAKNSINGIHWNNIVTDVTGYHYYENLKDDYSESQIVEFIENGRAFTALLLTSSFIISNYLERKNINLSSMELVEEVAEAEPFISGFVNLLFEELEKVGNPINHISNMGFLEGNNEPGYNFVLLKFMMDSSYCIKILLKKQDTNLNVACQELSYNLFNNSGVIFYQKNNSVNQFKSLSSREESIWVINFISKVSLHVKSELKKFDI